MLCAECLLGRRGVISRAMPHLIRLAIRILRQQLYLYAPEGRVRNSTAGVESQKVLCAQLVTNLAKGIIQLHSAFGVIVFAASIFGNLNERVLAAQVAARSRLYRNNNDAVLNGFGLLGPAQGIVVIGLAGGIAAVSNQDQHLAARAVNQGVRAEENCVVNGSSRAHAQAVNAAINPLYVGGKAGKLVNVLRHLKNREMIFGAKNRMNEFVGRRYFQLELALGTGTGINGQRDAQWHRRLLLENSDVLRH